MQTDWFSPVTGSNTIYFYFAQGQKHGYFYLVSTSWTPFPSFSIVPLGKGTVGRADNPELIVQTETKNYTENIKIHICFQISFLQLANLPTILFLGLQFLTSPFSLLIHLEISFFFFFLAEKKKIPHFRDDFGRGDSSSVLSLLY